MSDARDVDGLIQSAISACIDDGEYDPAEDLIRDPLARLCCEALGEAAAELERLRESLGDCRESLRIEVLENEKLRKLAFHTGPGEFSPEGWTWQQQAACDLARALEAEAALAMATLAHDLAAVLDFDPSIEVYIYPNGDGNYGVRLIAPDEKMDRELGCVFRVLGCDLTKLMAECRAWCDRNKGPSK